MGRLRVGRKKVRRRAKEQAQVKAPGDGEPGPWAYWLILLVAIGWAIWANADLARGRETLSWRETPGRVVHTEIEKRSHSSSSRGNSGRAGGGGGGSTSYTWHVAVEYRYQVEGLQYSGNRIRWDGGWSFDKADDARAKVRELEARPELPVYYNPVQPAAAVLVRGAGVGKLLAGVAMLGGATGLLTFSYLRARHWRMKSSNPARRKPSVKLAVLVGIAGAVGFGGLQYLAYVRLFAS